MPNQTQEEILENKLKTLLNKSQCVDIEILKIVYSLGVWDGVTTMIWPLKNDQVIEIIDRIISRYKQRLGLD